MVVLCCFSMYRIHSLVHSVREEARIAIGVEMRSLSNEWKMQNAIPFVSLSPLGPTFSTLSLSIERSRNQSLS